MLPKKVEWKHPMWNKAKHYSVPMVYKTWC